MQYCNEKCNTEKCNTEISKFDVADIQVLVTDLLSDFLFHTLTIYNMITGII